MKCVIRFLSTLVNQLTEERTREIRDNCISLAEMSQQSDCTFSRRRRRSCCRNLIGDASLDRREFCFACVYSELLSYDFQVKLNAPSAV